MSASMTIEEERVAHVTILRLAGRLELDDGDTTLKEHINRLADEGRVNLILDLTKVTRLDSAGIGMLVSKYLTVKRHGGTIKLLHLTDRTSKLLNMTKLATVFEIFEEDDQALQSFAIKI